MKRFISCGIFLMIVCLLALPKTLLSFPPLNPPKLDSRNYKDLVSEAKELETRATKTLTAGSDSNTAEGQTSRRPSTSRTDSRSARRLGIGRSCCGRELAGLRRRLARVRSDVKKLQAYYRQEKDEQGLRTAAKMGAEADKLDKALHELDTAAARNSAREALRVISGSSRVLHDTAMAVIRKLG